MIKDEALKLALEALESGVKTTANRISWMEYDSELIEKAITAIKEALAQPAQEPVAWMDICEKGQMSGLRYWSEPDNRHEIALYTTPPKPQTACCAECGKKESDGWFLYCVDCMDEVNTSTAQLAQEPVGWIDNKGNMICTKINESCKPLYTTSPQRPWVGLTDEDFQPAVQKAMMYYGYEPKHSTLTSGAGFYGLVRSIEAKLKDKNS